MKQSIISNTKSLEIFEKIEAIRIAIVIPTLKEVKSIGAVLDDIADTLQKEQVYVVVVDGHSDDGTDEAARKKGAIVIYQDNKGYGDALKAGFNYIMKNLDTEIIVMIDADSTYDAKDIPALIDPILQDNADLVLGNRFTGMQKGSMPLTNKLGNKLISWFARRILKVKVHDTQSGFRAFRSEIMKSIELESDGMPFAIEMLVEARSAGARICEVPVNYRKRVGNTKLNPMKDGLSIFVTIIRLMRDTQPLTFFGGVSGILGLSGLILGLDVSREWILTGTITRLPTVMFSVLLMIGAIQFFSIGLVADMIKNLKKHKFNK